jgi:hypothetical protein
LVQAKVKETLYGHVATAIVPPPEPEDVWGFDDACWVGATSRGKRNKKIKKEKESGPSVLITGSTLINGRILDNEKCS